MAEEVLRIENLQAWYGESHILHGVNLTVHKGEVVTLLGRNGAGRTSTLKSVLGLVGRRTGSIKLNGVETVGMPTYKIAHMGIAYVPEERGIFSSLSVEENLTLPPEIAKGGMSLDEITEGLAPVIVQALGRVIVKLKERGFTIVLVEQNFRFAAPLADRHYVMEHGKIAETFAAAELESKTQMLHEYLGV